MHKCMRRVEIEPQEEENLNLCDNENELQSITCASLGSCLFLVFVYYRVLYFGYFECCHLYFIGSCIPSVSAPRYKEQANAMAQTSYSLYMHVFLCNMCVLCAVLCISCHALAQFERAAIRHQDRVSASWLCADSLFLRFQHQSNLLTVITCCWNNCLSFYIMII